MLVTSYRISNGAVMCTIQIRFVNNVKYLTFQTLLLQVQIIMFNIDMGSSEILVCDIQ